MTPTAEVIADVIPPAPRVAGVRLDGGEIVIIALRQHWSVPAIVGGAPAALLLATLASLTLSRSSPMPSGMMGVLAGLALTPLLVALFRHAGRWYVLTDRRVIVRHGRDVRWVALGAVQKVDCSALAGKVGDVVIRSAQGVLVWPRVPDAHAGAAAVSEAVERYGRG